MIHRPPLEYTVDVPNRRALVTYHRQPTSDEWKEHVEELFRDPSFQRDFAVLFDRTALTGAPDVEYVRKLVEYVDEMTRKHGPRRWVCVVNDIGSFGLGRMAEQTSAYPGTIRVFKTMPEAQAWLHASM